MYTLTAKDSLKVAVNIEFREGLQNCLDDTHKQEILDAVIIDQNKIYRSFTLDYLDCLEKCRKWRQMSYTDLEAETYLNYDFITRVFNGTQDPSPRTLALICLAMRLPYRMSMHIFEHSPCGLPCAQRSNRKTHKDKNDEMFIDAALSMLPGQPMDVILKFFEAHNIAG